MPRVTHNQTNFTAGELSPKLYGRVDIAKYGNGVALLQNMIPLIQGGAISRNGTRYVSPTRYGALSNSRLIPFVFNRDQAYILEFGERYIRFYRDGAMIMDEDDPSLPYELVSPFSADMLDGLDFAQQSDTLIMVHQEVTPYRLQRYGHAKWQFEAIPFVSIPTSETGYTPFAFASVDTSPTAGQSIDVGDTVNIYCYTLDSDGVTKVDAHEFIDSDVGRRITFPGGLVVEATLFTDNSNLKATVKNSPGVVVGPRLYEARTWTIEGSPQASLKPSATGPVGTAITMQSGGAGTSGAAVNIAASGFSTPASSLYPSPVSYGTPKYGLFAYWDGYNYFIYLQIETSAVHGLSDGDSFLLSGFTAYGGADDINGVYKVRKVLSTTKILTSKVFRDTYVDTTKLNAAGAAGSYGTVQQVTATGASFPTFRHDDVGGMISINGGFARITGIITPSKIDAVVTKELSSTTTAVKNSWVLSLPSWSDGFGYPGAVTIATQRLIFAGSPSYPNSIWMSRVAEYYNNDLGVDDSDAINITISSKEVVDIRHLTENSGIVVLSTGGEHAILGGVERPVTPTNVQIKAQSAFGCSGVQPVRIGAEIFYPQRSGLRIRAMSYQYSSDSYNSPDISALSDHLLVDGIKAMAYQQEPYSVLWVVTNAGELKSCTIDREQNVIAWARHNSGNGVFESVACIPNGDEDQVWFIIKRTIKDASDVDTDVRYIERFDPTLYHDCAGDDVAVAPEATVPLANETTALIARFATPPSNARKAAIDAFIVSMKADGIWDKLDSLYVFAAADSQAAYLDWKRDLKNGTLAGTASFTADVGVKGNAAAGSRFETDFTPSVDGTLYTLNSASMGCYVATRPTTDGTYFGSYGTSINQHIDIIESLGNVSGHINSTFNMSGGTLTGGGLLTYCRTSSAATAMYQNGTLLASDTDASGGLSTQPVWLGASNHAGVEASRCDVELSVWFAGAALDATEQTAFKSAIDTYLAAL